MSGSNGSSHANRMRFVQLPIRNQMTAGAAGLPTQRATKSSSLVTTVHPPEVAKFQMLPSVGVAQAELADGRGGKAVFTEPSREGGRQLRVHEQTHGQAWTRTVWSR
jgi:hypothetical protein